MCVWEERVGEWTNNKAHVFYHQRKGKSGRIWKGAVALQLSVWDVYGIEGDERLVLARNFPQKCFFLEKDYLLVLKGMRFVWEGLSSLYSECAECEKGMCVPVHPSLLLPSTWCVNLRFKCCTLKSSPLPAPDQTLIIQFSTSWMIVLVNGSFAVSIWVTTVVPVALLVQRSLFFTKWRIRKNCKISYGKPDLLVINAVITGRGTVGVDCLNSKKRR